MFWAILVLSFFTKISWNSGLLYFLFSFCFVLTHASVSGVFSVVLDLSRLEIGPFFMDFCLQLIYCSTLLDFCSHLDSLSWLVYCLTLLAFCFPLDFLSWLFYVLIWSFFESAFNLFSSFLPFFVLWLAIFLWHCRCKWAWGGRVGEANYWRCGESFAGPFSFSWTRLEQDVQLWSWRRLDLWWWRQQWCLDVAPASPAFLLELFPSFASAMHQSINANTLAGSAFCLDSPLMVRSSILLGFGVLL